MRYIFGVFAVVIIMIIAIILIVTRSPKPADNTVKTGQKVLLASDYAHENATASFTTEGRLLGEESRRAIRISVTPNLRTVEELDGYNQTSTRTQSYTNTQAGYEEFLLALDNSGFNRKRETTLKDERGVCPLGRTFILALNKGNDQPLRLWATSCSAKQGTAAGAVTTIQQLFQNQIPDYNKFVSNVIL
jgi:hypothetical protein